MGRRVHMRMGLSFVGVGPSSVGVAIADHLRGTGLDPVLYLPHAEQPLPAGLPAIGPLSLPRQLVHRSIVRRATIRRMDRRLVRAVRREGPGTLVWLWPDTPLPVVRALKDAGAVIVREMINTRRGTAKRVLDAEYRSLGLPPEHGVTPALVAEEDAEVPLADHVVSPSEAVDASLIEWGTPESRIIRSTFGWDETLAQSTPARLDGPGVKAIFVGSVGVRKGIHLALDAWAEAGIDGTLTIVGRIDPAVRDRVEAALGERVRHLPFTRDLGALYRAADFMLFPTLEEGAPLVVYQAAGCGLPILTSPMGRARIVEDEVSGVVVDPHDRAGLVAGIRRMGTDPAFRARMAAEAKRRADRMTWANAAAERARAILERVA